MSESAIEYMVRKAAEFVPAPTDIPVVTDPRDGAFRTVLAEVLPKPLEQIDWAIDCGRVQPLVYMHFDQLVGRISMTPEQTVAFASGLLFAASQIMQRRSSGGN